MDLEAPPTDSRGPTIISHSSRGGGPNPDAEMGEVQFDELCLGAGLDVQALTQHQFGHPEVEEKELQPNCEPQETPKRRDVSIRRVVTVETSRMEEEKGVKKKEEERWRELFPEIKKCVTVRLDMMKLKQEEGEGEGVRSSDPEPDSDWMEPLELDDDSSSAGRLRRFVKQVEFQMNPVPANRPRRPRGRMRGSELLRLRLCGSPDVVTADRAHHHQLWGSQRQNKRTKENVEEKEDFNNNTDPLETHHNYSNVPGTPDTYGQSQEPSLSSCWGQKDGDSYSCSTGIRPPVDWSTCLSPIREEKKKPPNIVFKKVGGDQWVLRRPDVKDEEGEGKEEGGSSINTDQVKLKKTKTSPTDTLTPGPESVRDTVEVSVTTSPVTKLKRRSGCKTCAACLREDCGKCVSCLDKKKFGGPRIKKQRCQFRVCLVAQTKNKSRPRAEDESMATTTTVATMATTATTATKPECHQWRRQRGEKVTTEEEEKTSVKRRRRKWGGNVTKIKRERVWTRRLKKEEEEEEEKKTCDPAQEAKNRWRRKRTGRRKAKTELEEDDWTQPLMMEEGEEEEEEKKEEEEPKKETDPPQFELLGVTGELCPEGLMTGTHIQLNLTLDSRHFTSSILSDSTLINLSGLLPQIYVQDGSVLTFIPPPAPPAPPPSLPPQLLQPKEEEEALEIDTYRKVGVEGGQSEEEEEECREGVTERGKYYDMEVEVLGSDSDERTLALSSLLSEVADDDVTAEVTGDVTASDLIYEPPECISLSSGLFSLSGGRVSDDVTGGQGLLQLLQGLRGTVLPALWVSVLADGPVLQLLQCSWLSSMADTMVHIQPDRCFYITVQSRLLPDTHTLYHTHTQRITHLSQVVSLLLELERLIVCRGSMVRSSTCQLEVRSPTCHLLVAPPFLTCLPCLLEEEGGGGRG